MKKQEIILTIGLPASGKSTWADEFIRSHQNYVNINRDDLRLMVFGKGKYKFTNARELLITDIARTIAVDTAKQGKSIVISDTNLSPARNQYWKDFAVRNDMKYTEKNFMHVPHGVCIERDSKREKPVGANVILNMYNTSKVHWLPGFEHSEDLEDCYIVDIDGTIAEMKGRTPYDWDKVDTDLPKDDVINIINTLKTKGSRIILMSGRDGQSRELTENWLKQHLVEYDELHMRTKGDSRKDYIVKNELFETHVKDKFNVVGVFDDRDQVVHLWRHLGFTCFQCGYGPF